MVYLIGVVGGGKLLDPAPHLGPYILGGTNEYRYNCPFCLDRKGTPDTGNHLYVNPNKLIHGIRGWFNCYRCGAKGPAKKLFRSGVGIDTDISKWNEFVKKLKYGNSDNIDIRSALELPLDYEEITIGSRAYDYLIGRGVSRKKIKLYKLGMGTENMMDIPKEERGRYAGSGRIVIPDFDSCGNVVYWIARTYVGHKFRYKNPPTEIAHTRDKIFNLSRAMEYDDVIIAEGAFSAISAGINAVATYGKNVTTKQLNMLVAASFSRYFVALDGDARKESMKLAEDLNAKNKDVYLVEFDYKDDPDSVKDLQERIINALPFGNVKGRVTFVIGAR